MQRWQQYWIDAVLCCATNWAQQPEWWQGTEHPPQKHNAPEIRVHRVVQILTTKYIRVGIARTTAGSIVFISRQEHQAWRTESLVSMPRQVSGLAVSQPGKVQCSAPRPHSDSLSLQSPVSVEVLSVPHDLQ